MEDWQYRYDATTQDRWLQQVATELKGKPIESLAGEWWPGEIRHPAHHFTGAEAPIFLNSILFQKPPAIIESIDASGKNAEEINKAITLALSFGAQTILLYNFHSVADQPEVLFKNVILDFVNIIIQSDGDHTYAIDSIHKHIIFRKHYDLFSQPHVIGHQYVYPVPAEGDWIQIAVTAFRAFVQNISKAVDKKAALQHSIIAFSPGEDYLKSIIQMRVIHQVYELICHHFEIEYPTPFPYLECHIQPGGQTNNDQYILSATSAALAASLCGAHGVLIAAPGPDAPVFYTRTVRNIHHLLSMESEMYKQTDPLAGSFTIDHYTRRWTSMIVAELGF